MSRWLVVFLVASLSILAVPTGSAQVDSLYHFQTKVWVSPDAQPVEPVRGSGHVVAKVEVRCGPFGVAPIEPVPIELDVAVDKPWAVATVSPQRTTVQFQTQDCIHGYSDSLHAAIQFSFTEDAPAFERVTFQLRVAMPYADVVTEEWQQMAGLYFHTAARTEASIIHAAANQHVQVPITIENHGNGLMQAHFRLDDESSSHLSVALPAPVIVPAFGGVTTVNVDINTPFGFDGTRRDAVLVELVPGSADDASLHDASIQLGATIVTQGDGGSGGLPAEELPAPGFVAPLAALAALGAALRRRLE